MSYLTLEEVLVLHELVLDQTGGMQGVRDRGSLESALAQPQMSFGNQELYPELADKAAALAYSLVCNHPFNDGNKRIGHAAMEVFLLLNGWELDADVDEQEQLIIQLASGKLTREALVHWVKIHMVELKDHE